MTLADLRGRATITVEEAADLLGMGRNQVYAACQNGQLPALKLGARWVVPVPRLLALLGADEQEGEGQ